MILATWFYSSPSGENFPYPGVGHNSGDEDFQLCYFKCVMNFFASSYFNNYEDIKNAKLRHIFLCNSMPSYLEKIKFSEAMSMFNVEIIKFIPTRIPEFSKNSKLLFGSVFTQLDAIQRLCEVISDDDKILLMDNDVLVNKPVMLISNEISDDPIVLKQQSGALDQKIQGIPLKILMQISDSVGGEKKCFRPYIHTGGELVAMSGRSLRIFSLLCNNIYDRNLSLSNSDGVEDYFKTEEQIFSSAYQCFDNLKFANFISRIWTDQNKFRTVNGSENDLTFLHIPSEKRAGFLRLFEQLFELVCSGKPLPQSLKNIYQFSNLQISCNL